MRLHEREIAGYKAILDPRPNALPINTDVIPKKIILPKPVHFSVAKQLRTQQQEPVPFPATGSMDLFSSQSTTPSPATVSSHSSPSAHQSTSQPPFDSKSWDFGSDVFSGSQQQPAMLAWDSDPFMSSEVASTQPKTEPPLENKADTVLLPQQDPWSSLAMSPEPRPSPIGESPVSSAAVLGSFSSNHAISHPPASLDKNSSFAATPTVPPAQQSSIYPWASNSADPFTVKSPSLPSASTATPFNAAKPASSTLMSPWNEDPFGSQDPFAVHGTNSGASPWGLSSQSQSQSQPHPQPQAQPQSSPQQWPLALQSPTGGFLNSAASSSISLTSGWTPATSLSSQPVETSPSYPLSAPSASTSSWGSAPLPIVDPFATPPAAADPFAAPPAGIQTGGTQQYETQQLHYQPQLASSLAYISSTGHQSSHYQYQQQQPTAASNPSPPFDDPFKDFS